MVWGGDWPEDPGDTEIVTRAHSEARVVVTIDKDFGELAVLQRIEHSGIVRLSGIPTRSQGWACLKALAQFSGELSEGALATVEPHRVRLRSAR